MGTDCKVVIEKKCKGYTRVMWETIGVMHVPRNYEFFEDLRCSGFVGYPEDIDWLSKDILEATEDWGEGHMYYTDFLKLLKKHDMKDLDVIKKKLRDDCRVIYRFDN